MYVIAPHNHISATCETGGVSEVSGNRSCSDRDTLIEQSITLMKQSASHSI